MTQPCSSTSARSNGTTSFSTARTSSIVPGSVSNRSLCCISTPIWALPLRLDDLGDGGNSILEHGDKIEHEPLVEIDRNDEVRIVHY